MRIAFLIGIHIALLLHSRWTRRKGAGINSLCVCHAFSLRFYCVPMGEKRRGRTSRLHSYGAHTVILLISDFMVRTGEENDALL